LIDGGSKPAKMQKTTLILTTMATIYKANGRSFESMEDVQIYVKQNDFIITDKDEFIYKGKRIVCINLKSK
jgi:ornithine carbamoyltransferase